MPGREAGPYPLSGIGRKLLKMIDALVARGWSVTQAFFWAFQKMGVSQESDTAEEVAQVITQDHPEWFRKNNP